jgi:hypothetical protein
VAAGGGFHLGITRGIPKENDLIHGLHTKRGGKRYAFSFPTIGSGGERPHKNFSKRMRL